MAPLKRAGRAVDEDEDDDEIVDVQAARSSLQTASVSASFAQPSSVADVFPPTTEKKGAHIDRRTQESPVARSTPRNHCAALRQRR